jgi:hypothetical protein
MPRQGKIGERLRGALSDRYVFIDEGAYVGIASDGQEVLLGYFGDEKSIEKFLRRFPGPREW